MAGRYIRPRLCNSGYPAWHYSAGSRRRPNLHCQLHISPCDAGTCRGSPGLLVDTHRTSCTGPRQPKLAMTGEHIIMKTATTIASVLARLSGLIQSILGLLIWTGNFDALIPVHILVGSVLVLSLWTLAFLAAE